MKAVILNDTRPDAHHGCTRVMQVLEAGLRTQGFTVMAKSPLRHKWWADAAFLKAMGEADAIVINGEGTMHHGKRAAQDLLRVADHPVRGKRPVFLVNALYQDNPDSWRDYLAAMAGIWARDSRSADALGKLLDRPVPYLPDLTLCAGALHVPAKREGIIVGDAVEKTVAARLAGIARSGKHRLVPSVTRLKRAKGRTRVARGLRELYARFHLAGYKRANPTLSLIEDQELYAATLASAELHVTGRFHGACFSILTQTPFICVGSNSWKIEALLDDVGLEANRVVDIDGLEDAMSRDWRFSPQEEHAMSETLAKASALATEMFETIARTARTGAG